MLLDFSLLLLMMIMTMTMMVLCLFPSFFASFFLSDEKNDGKNDHVFQKNDDIVIIFFLYKKMIDSTSSTFPYKIDGNPRSPANGINCIMSTNHRAVLICRL